MHWIHFVWPLLALSVGCTHASERPRSATEKRRVPTNVRLAQAQLNGQEGAPIFGAVNFEQMPNSTIVTFHIEGLQPKNKYQILVHESENCTEVNLAEAASLARLSAGRKGVAENTFRTQRVTLSGQQSLVGQTVVIGRLPANEKEEAPTQIACGTVEPWGPESTIQ